MADEKLSANTNEVAAPTDDARFYVVDDVGGTPADGYIEKQNMASAVGAKYGFNPLGLGPAGTITYFPLLGGRHNSSLSDALTGTDTYFFPFVLGEEVSITHLSVDCITAVGGVTRKTAIFDMDGSALVANSEATFDLGTTGYKTVALAATITLKPGKYWFGSRNSASGTQIRCFSNDAQYALGIRSPGANIEGDMSFWGSDTSPGTFAAWPGSTCNIDNLGGTANRYWVIATVT